MKRLAILEVNEEKLASCNSDFDAEMGWAEESGIFLCAHREMDADTPIDSIQFINWIPVSEQCPEVGGEKWLVTLKSGTVECAIYDADEESDYWENIDKDASDTFFDIDPVIAWAQMPHGYNK